MKDNLNSVVYGETPGDANADSAILDWLFNLQRFGVKPGLERVHALLAAVGDPQREFQVVLVGGTNGKGTTARTLATILSASRQNTALFTSPHLTQVMERFQLDGLPLPRAELLRVLSALRPAADELGATFFEILVAAACRLFADARASTAVIEVGLGGRLDATNALDPVLSVITGVALDHTAVLGRTSEEIALDKSGIFRAGVPAVTGASGTALEVLEAQALQTGTPLQVLGRDCLFSVTSLGWSGSRVTVQLADGPVVVTTPLAGPFQARNTALAVAAAAALGVPRHAFASGVAAVSWPGRLERLAWQGRWVVLDGAHNPAGAAALSAALQQLGVRPRVLIAGVNADKDVAGVVAGLSSIAEHVIVTAAALSGRAARPAELRTGFGLSAETAADPKRAVARALELTEAGDVIVVAGSLYLIGEIRPLLTGEAQEKYERWQ